MKPVVSICCITYNHEKYISDAIESFLMQETSFPFEIIIHDDASTDNTANIIRKYQKRYPKVIKPIYQTENQYSQGQSPITNFVIPRTKGEYIATCEGDDYWIDTKKLEKQVEFLENNKKYIMCFHAVKVVDTNKKFTGRYLGLLGKGSKKVNIKESAKGGIVHVSSRVIRSNYYKKSRPKWMRNAIHGDYAAALNITAQGGVFYIDETMSAYRTGVENSMMTNIKNNYSKENDISYQSNRIETLNMADEYYDYKYHEDIKEVNLISEVIISILKNDYSKISRKTYRDFVKVNGFISLIKIFLLKKYPFIGNSLVSIKNKMFKLKIKDEIDESKS